MSVMALSVTGAFPALVTVVESGLDVVFFVVAGKVSEAGLNCSVPCVAFAVRATVKVEGTAFTRMVSVAAREPVIVALTEGVTVHDWPAASWVPQVVVRV